MAESYPAEKSTRKKGYAPTDADYHIESIRIEEAENGVVVCCGYALNEDIREKLRNQEKSDGLYAGCSYHDDERHVFENKEDAKAFIIGELNQLWAGEAGDDRS